MSRSIKGVPRPIFYKGEQVGEWRHFDERLAMFLLRYRRPARFGAHLDSLPGPDGDEDDAAEEPMGRLEWLLDELTDHGDPPLNLPAPLDGGNFGNFADDDDDEEDEDEGPLSP
jgi:hypothetical protein